MPMKPDGTWEPEDDSVANRVTALTSQDSALMKGAETKGLQSANRRGLLNSSVAVEAAQKAGYDAAIPIASQEASQAASKNLQGMANTNQQLIQQRDISAQDSRLTKQLTSTEGIAARELDAAGQRLTQQLASEEGRATADRQANQQIAAAQISSNDRRAAMDTIATFEQSYQTAMSNVMANDKIPAATRNAFQASIAASRNSNIALVEQMYGVDLTWARTRAA